MSIISFLQTIPPLAVYLVIGLLVAIESVGVPVPGETALITGAVMSTHAALHVSAVWVFVAAFSGAVLGDSFGYSVGRRYGPALLVRLGRRFPRHVSADRVAYAEYLFEHYGMGTVFVGRFIALLRMLAGPLAGMLHLTYPRFLLANASGAACWAGIITVGIHLLGTAAESWFAGGAWVLLLVLLVVGLVGGRVLARTFDHRVEAYARERLAAGEIPTAE
ncbi:membrane protein DedA, SNARE-associated domain [Raineyella antarctica]|uniref:Membrane protein DedA, SNARE-associated domain n=1 Tax=Raineyella antarctica TaxID=1577474 RepID=A0A1G6HFY4_9ACTN|nr:DedA family protein [Raineyella antarctica]SDB93074.1 membrane protein DedA, SNARE-associated domain [Raineyella antarctica]